MIFLFLFTVLSAFFYLIFPFLAVSISLFISLSPVICSFVAHFIHSISFVLSPHTHHLHTHTHTYTHTHTHLHTRHCTHLHTRHCTHLHTRHCTHLHTRPCTHLHTHNTYNYSMPTGYTGSWITLCLPAFWSSWRYYLLCPWWLATCTYNTIDS